MPPKTRTIRPQKGPQEDFLSSNADIVIYGGSRGAGKSFALIMAPLAHIDVSGFGCVIFRRTFPQITNEGGLWDESSNLYPHLGARPTQNDLTWRFPSGAAVSFAHMQNEADIENWKGAQVPLIGLDQIEQFSEKQFWGLLGSNRSTCGVLPYIRATCN